MNTGGSVVIVGAGEITAKLLHVAGNTDGLRIAGIVDTDPQAPAMALARQLKIEVSDQLSTFLATPSVQRILLATTDRGLRDQVSQQAPASLEVVDILQGGVVQPILAAVEKNEALYRIFSEHSADVVVTLSLDLSFTYVSPSIIKLRGYSAEETLSQSLAQILTPASFEAAAKMLKEELAIEEKSDADFLRHRLLELEVVCKDGSTVWTELVVSFIRDATRAKTGILGLVRNIARRKKLELRLAKINECFLLFGPDPDNNINLLTGVCGQIMGGKWAVYNRFHKDYLFPVGSWNVPVDYCSVNGAESCMCLDAIRQKREDVMVVGGLQGSSYAPGNANISRHHLSTYVGCPVKCGADYAGVLCVVYDVDYWPDESDNHLLRIIAAAIGIEENRRLSQSTMIQAQLRYAELWNNLNVGVFRNTADPEGRFLEVNPSLVAMLDAESREELFSYPVRSFYANEQQRVEIVDKIFKYGFFANEEIEMITLKKRKFWALATAAAKKDPNGETYLYGVLQDITERKEAQDRLSKAYEELKNMQMQLIQVEKMAGIGLLAAGVAHEINNPLSFLISNLGFLKEDGEKLLKALSAVARQASLEGTDGILRIREALATVDIAALEQDFSVIAAESLEGADRIKKIVRSLLTFSRADKGEMQDVDINEEIEKSLTIVWNEIKYNCDVTKDFQSLPKIYGNPGQLSQVFVNLIVNAHQATDKKRALLVIKTYVRDSMVCIEFSDNGKGISPEIMSKIFQPFFTTKDPGKGTGIGLSVVYSIIEKHKGTIEVSSEVGKGTTFLIKLPITVRT